MRAHSRNRLDSRGSALVSKITERFLTIRSAEGFWCAIRFYTIMRTTRAVIDRCSWSITVHYTWMASQKFCLTWRAVLKMFVRLFRIEQVKASLKFRRSYFQRRKMKEWRQKELLTTGGCLNYKKSSQQLQLHSRVSSQREIRFTVLQNVFAIILLWASEGVGKLSIETVYK